MQNYILKNYKKTNIPFDIRSEIMFREAEDCYFYFSKTKSAIKKLNIALELNPCHFKALMLKGDILFSNGNYDEALNLYTKALELKENNPRTLGAIANCLNELLFFKDALDLCSKALSLPCEKNLYSSLYELKIKILMNLREYGKVKNHLNTPFINNFENLVILKNMVSKILESKTELKKRLQKTKLKAI